MTDLELLRIADTDEEAFVILVMERLPHVRTMIKDWCTRQDEDCIYLNIAEATVYTAVDYARHLRPDVLAFDPSDWLQQIAVIVFFDWVELNVQRESSTPTPWTPVVLSPEEQVSRTAEARTVERHFRNMKMPDHREILERVMSGGSSPEEAGRSMGLRSDIVARIIFRAALEELLCLIKSDISHETKAMLLEDGPRVQRCLELIKSDRERLFLDLVYNHSLDPLEAGGRADVEPGYTNQFHLESLRELFALIMNDWRDSWRRPVHRP